MNTNSTQKASILTNTYPNCPSKAECVKDASERAAMQALLCIASVVNLRPNPSSVERMVRKRKI